PAQVPLIGQPQAVDGDTIRLGGARIRLWGVDAPEARQDCLDASGRSWACGEAATARLRAMLAGGPASCTPQDRDRYGRVVAGCSTAGRDLGARMVALGLAVDWPRYSKGAYRDEEEAARSEKIGMWAGSFTLPWRWRQEHGR